MKAISKVTALVFALAMALMLVACGGNAGSSASSAAGGASASGSASASGELVGKPWVTSVMDGNLPAEQPVAKDDLYTHYNYEYLSAHQGSPSSTIIDHSGELQTSTMAIIKDESKTGHDLDQLRLFYNQAADTKALEKAGLSEIQPYLDRIEAVKSIDEMNALLTADDFPFSPFLLASISANDTRTTNIVAVNPNFVLSDALAVGGLYYQESDDQQTQRNLEAMRMTQVQYPIVDLMSAGLSKDDAQETATTIIDFEKAHGKCLDAPSTYLKADYGAMAEASRNSYFTMDELSALSPNFPVKAILEKLGKGGSTTYACTKAWLEAFNGLWTEENLETIKLVARTQVLSETRPYRDPSVMNETLKNAGMAVPDADSFAYTACTSLNTLSNVVAKTYVDEVLGADAKSRLTALSQNLVGTYKDLINNTAWMSEESKQRVVEKLDHMTLNVLEPQGGYFDYSGLELTPTDQGGTLFQNYLKLKKYRQDCESKMVGQPAVAATPWYSISPTESNAFYEPTSNSINVYPGFVTSLIYANGMSDAELLAGAGFTIGHEISHGFDYAGSQLDAYGTPTPVFADADVDKFVLKSTTLAQYYKGIEIEPGLMVDGELVAGEATADLCGVQACLEIAGKTEGFDYEKYFADLSNVWAQVISEAQLQQRTVDVHPLNNLRINVSLQMFDPIYDKLGVAEGDGMFLAPDERIAIWGPNA